MLLRIDKKLTINSDVIQSPNLTDRFSPEDLSRIGTRVWEGYNRDRFSRLDWMRRNNAGMNLAMQISKDKSYPWPNCSNIIFPLITIAAVNFSTKSYGNLVQGSDVVQYRVFGDDPDGVQVNRAQRIGKHMSWQVLEEDKAWEDQHDRLLINLAVVGTNFVKTRYNAKLGCLVSELVMAKDFVLNYWAKSVEECNRKTHIIPLFRNDIYERVKEKTYSDVLEESWFQSAPVHLLDEVYDDRDKRSGTTPPVSDEDTPFRGLEQHCLLDLDQDGYAEPYIVTIEEGSRKVLRIAARFEREEAVERTSDRKILRVHPTEYFTKYTFIPSPDGGIYDVGFGYLLGPINEGVNTAINQIFDAGTMANSNGGFLGRGAKIRGGAMTFAPWEWKRVDSTGDDLKKSMVPLPTREPSTVLLSVLQFLVTYADRLAGTVEQSVGQTPGQNTPAETSRNALENGLQIYGMIFKRVWRSMKGEFQVRHRFNAMYLPDIKKYGTAGGKVLREDYLSNSDNLAPVADPNIVSSSMRIGQAQAMREAAHSVPGYNIQEVERNFLRALRVDQIDRFYPGPDKVPPLPNPKLQVEQLKLQVKQMDMKRKEQELILKLQEQRRETDAKIMLLRAQSMEIIAGIDLAQKAHALEVFNSAIEALEAHNNALNQNIQTLQQMSGDSDGNSESGGMGSVGGQPSNQGGSGSSGPAAGGA